MLVLATAANTVLEFGVLQAKPDMSAAKDVKNDPDLWENPTARIGIYGHLQG